MTARACLAALVLALAASAAADSSGPAPVKGLKSTVLPDGLEYFDLRKGTGAEAKPGKTVKVHYTGWLADGGKKFDSSVGKEPFEFELGSGMVIKGWDEGIAGMKVGGKRQLRVPAKLGYGDRGAGAIPPGSDLVFDCALIDVH